MRVLDVAAGTGSFAVPLVQRVQKENLQDVAVLATDLSPGLLETLKKNATEAGIAVTPAGDQAALGQSVDTAAAAAAVDVVSLQTAVDDAQKMTAAADASQDLVVCVFGLMLFPDPAAAAKEMFRVLKPGGRLLVVTWQQVGTVEAIRAMAAEMGLPADAAEPAVRVAYKFNKPELLQALLQDEVGFVNVQVEECQYQRDRSLITESADQIVKNPALIQSMDLSKVNPADAVACIKRMALDPKNTFLETATALITRAEKP